MAKQSVSISITSLRPNDADHIGGHAEIIEAFGTDQIGAVHGPTMDGVKNPESNTYKQYLQTPSETGLKVNELQEG